MASKETKKKAGHERRRTGASTRKTPVKRVRAAPSKRAAGEKAARRKFRKGDRFRYIGEPGGYYSYGSRGYVGADERPDGTVRVLFIGSPHDDLLRSSDMERT